MYEHLLFAGPWVRGEGEVPTRIVMHAPCLNGEPEEYVVHMQYRNEAGQLHYESGNYFMKHDNNAFRRAIERFSQRSADHYHEGRKLLYLDQPDGDTPLPAQVFAH